MRKFIPLVAFPFALAAISLTVVIVHPQPAKADASVLTLKCHAPSVAFEDGTSFAAFHLTLNIDPADGWTIQYDQFVKQFPEGVTVTIAREPGTEPGTYLKFDKSSHRQFGSCHTADSAAKRGPSRPGW